MCYLVIEFYHFQVSLAHVYQHIVSIYALEYLLSNKLCIVA